MVNHPVRRRIVMSLMLVGSAGLVTVVASLMLSFTGAGHRQTLHRVLLLIAGLTVVWLLARSRPRLHPRRLSQPGGVALGTQAGEARLTDVLRDGGFTRVRRVAETPLNLVLEARP